MKVFKHKDLATYEKTQVERSKSKFHQCKVSYRDVRRWHRVINNDLSKNKINFRICCLGSRSGIEVDLFRTKFSNNFILQLIYFFSSGIKNKRKFKIIFKINYFLKKIFSKLIYPIGRKNISFKYPNYTYGVEINPDAKRKDILVANFDFIPTEWNKKFNIIFSNSFDQSMDPYETSKKWNDLVDNQLSYFILCFAYEEPDYNDPTGLITFEDLEKLFPGEVIYRSENQHTYNEVIIKREIYKKTNQLSFHEKQKK
jgi:hypothetical protein